MHPISKVQTIPIPNEVKKYCALKPIGRSKLGRRKRRRIKVGSEHKSKKHYSICGQGKNNRRTCINKPIK